MKRVMPRTGNGFGTRVSSNGTAITQGIKKSKRGKKQFNAS
jgi:hypothetical protein